MATMKHTKPCAAIGCDILTQNYYCKIHEYLKPKRISPYKKGYGTKWREESCKFLKAHPYCNDCNGWAEEVHHEEKPNGNMAIFWNRAKWIPLCKRCHTKRTNEEIKAEKKKAAVDKLTVKPAFRLS